MNHNQHPNRPRQKLLRALLRAAAAILCLYSAAVLFLIPYGRYRQACTLLEDNEADSAAAVFETLGSFLNSAEKLDECNLLRAENALRLQSFEAAGAFFSAVVNQTGGRALSICRQAAAQADALFADGQYERAAACYAAFGDSQRAGLCAEALYNRLRAGVEQADAVPAGFDCALLRVYKDADLYALAHKIGESDWGTAAETAQNIALIYDELGDFLDAAAHGYAVQRLFQNRYVNSSGYYFQMDQLGNCTYNLPGYHLAGYYGLYTKISGGVLYIGSDEKESWTRQFAFTFSDYDQTLTVYSYRTGAQYVLYKEN